MSTAKSTANGSASPSLLTQASGRRSSSLEIQPRRTSGVHNDNGDVGAVLLPKVDRARSPLGSPVVAGASGTQGTSDDQGTDARLANAMAVGAIAPTPKERLPPSPPLTPVASISNLRKAAAGAGADLDATPKSGKSKETSVRVAADRSGTAADEKGLGDEVEVDTEVDGAPSTWSFRPDGDREASTQESANGDDGTFASAQPSSVAAIPQSSSFNIPQGPTPPQENQDPLSGTIVDPPNSFPGIFPFTTSPSSMPPSHEASSPLPPHLHPLHNAPSPQPWDLVDPPPGNNSQVEERMRRARKESNRSMPSTSANIVVKDGKKYRIPHSSYYFGPPPDTSAFGTDPVGHIGVHHPREIVRIERDYSGGELVQFSPAYPLELEGRISPTQFLETVNAINESLIEAHNLRWSFLDNAFAVLTLYISRLFVRSHYDREMKRLKDLVEGLNKQLYNPVGLNILWPKGVAFMFFEIEYY